MVRYLTSSKLSKVNKMEILLENILPTPDQVTDLYDQLRNRIHTISHNKLPSFNEHKQFVINNPYRAWFMIQVEKKSIGNVYVQFDNSIGLNINKKINESQIEEILMKLTDQLLPLKAVPSVRY